MTRLMPDLLAVSCSLLVLFQKFKCGLLLRCGTDNEQAISKKRERQVGEAQGALVVAQAQISGLEMQLQELTAAHKQASMQHTLSDLE